MPNRSVGGRPSGLGPAIQAAGIGEDQLCTTRSAALAGERCPQQKKHEKTCRNMEKHSAWCSAKGTFSRPFLFGRHRFADQLCFQELGNAKVLMPENTIPWGVTHFIGADAKPSEADAKPMPSRCQADSMVGYREPPQEVPSWASSRSFATALCCSPSWTRLAWPMLGSTLCFEKHHINVTSHHDLLENHLIHFKVESRDVNSSFLRKLHVEFFTLVDVKCAM